MIDEHLILYEECRSEVNKEFVCQCIVNTGSNNDSIGKNGISHVIEHFLINYSKRTSFFRDVKIHGFTGFYYTNYYWYVDNVKEALESFAKFEKIYYKSVICSEDRELFEQIKKDIEIEITFLKAQTDNVAKIISTLSDKDNNILVPIGNVNDVRKLEYGDMVEYLGKFYTSTNIYRFLINKSNQIFYLSKDNVENLQILCSTKLNYDSKSNLPFETINGISSRVLHFGSLHEFNSIKLVFKDVFINSIEEIIVGEIFVIQLCDLLKNTMCGNIKIEYEKIFISKEKIYFVLTIRDMELGDYNKKMQKKELDIYDLLQKVLEENGFNKIKTVLLKYLKGYDRTDVKINNIMSDLINYATLSYSSYNIINDIEKLVTFIDEIVYSNYCQYIYSMALHFEEGDVKLLY